ncbi:hypothetical protein QVN03_18240 [Raoultella terrigena]|nr:hypothetical protein [Raoultella terrigena]WJV37335.1 hypothetical protein QVN03_18240 [Raoultella terrigena]
MTDITELEQKPTRYGTNSQGVFTNQADGAYVSYQDFLVVVEALEQARRANDHLREQSAEWERKAISNFQECATMSERIYLLESRTVTVKLPPKVDGSNVPFAGHSWNCCLNEIEKRLAAAGIKWEAE